MKQPSREQSSFCGRTRRECIGDLAGGFASLALTGLLSSDGFFESQAVAADGVTPYGNPLNAKPPHFSPKAKHVIFLFMNGGPSHLDTFDYKPLLVELDYKTALVNTKGSNGEEKNEGHILGPKWSFKQHGQSGQWVSDLFPHVATCVDDIAFIKSMTTDSSRHGSAMLMMNAGRVLSGHPSLGSWVNYGLGSDNDNLPGYVVMLDQTGGPVSGAKNWSNGYMPAVYQGTVFHAEGTPILDLKHVHDMPRSEQRRLLDYLRRFNSTHLSDRAENTDLAARIASYELAFKMQSTAPEAVDLDSEPERIKRIYGIDEKRTESFGKKCLLARRLVERGVRFIQVYSGGGNEHNWDAHEDLQENHNQRAGATDKPIAGLLKDLKQRGLLSETLVIWGGEFGRQPIAEHFQSIGRDHNSYGFTMWMAGGGIQGGISVGKTDELGSAAVEHPFHIKNLHATVLHQLGIDPNLHTYFHGGLDQKLVGVEGAEPIWQVMS